VGVQTNELQNARQIVLYICNCAKAAWSDAERAQGRLADLQNVTLAGKVVRGAAASTFVRLRTRTMLLPRYTGKTSHPLTFIYSSVDHGMKYETVTKEDSH